MSAICLLLLVLLPVAMGDPFHSKLQESFEQLLGSFKEPFPGLWSPPAVCFGRQAASAEQRPHQIPGLSPRAPGDHP